MDSNDLLSQAFWIELRDDILYVLDKPNDEPSMDSKWNRFLKRMNFEARLEQRELQMKQIIGERKSLKYFVAQGLVRGSSIEDIAKLILSFTINSRFRESLLLAVGWISWKWPFDKYDTFCKLLFTRTENQSIPFGILLFFDAMSDIHRLPSNSAIFIALNNLLNHSSNEIRGTYLISNLSKLPENITIEWMKLYLKDDQCLSKFCQSFPTNCEKLYESEKDDRQPISSIIYQQLWSFHNRSSSIEFLIDQIFRKTLMSVEIPDQIFNKDLAFALSTQHHLIP
ncbi:unnamed protein product [Rotaria sordida]|uniref:Uncharacterized protein n=1 Tax=Rotaria sordida TaxID=392033 RepID=A0A819MZ75_9BILA|nr:unnamed protein product [Rotaria sordida]CAF3988553.1 unnamed protein product [Rotaria sordida]